MTATVNGFVDRFYVKAEGRPAPQGSKRLGQHGQMRESSPYLPAWRAAVKRAVYEQYRDLGIEASVLPLFRGAVALSIVFVVDASERRLDSAPDLDKLTRSTWDALTQARVWEDDGRVITTELHKRAATTSWTGAIIEIKGVPL